MSNIIQYDFSNAADFSFDDTVIEVIAGKAQLKNQVGNIDFTENFTNDTGFTYDNTKAEFVAGKVQQKDQRPANTTFGATYTTNINGNWGNGVLTGTAIGSPVIESNRLKLTTAGGGDRVNYAGLNNASACVQTGTVKYKFTPNYTTTLAADLGFFFLSQASNNHNNLLELTHSNGGNLNIALKNSAGSNIIYASVSAAAMAFVSGVTCEIKITFDATAGHLYIYKDGVEKFHGTGTGTRSSTIGILAVGTSVDGRRSNFYIEDFVVYSDYQPGAYTPGYILQETIYLENNIVCPEMEHTGEGTILLGNTFTTTESGSPRYSIQVGRSGNYLYWNGSAWAVSDGSYAQANTKATFNTNLPTLPVNGEDYGQLKVHFTESNTISDIDVATFNMSVNTGYVTTNPSITVNTAFTASELTNFATTQTTLGSDLIKHIVYVGGQAKYWSGAAIVDSNGSYSQSNTVAEILAHITDFLSTRSSVYVKSFLHSNDGTTTPNIDTIQFTYDSALSNPNLPEVIQLEGFLYNHNVPLNNEVIYIRPYQYGFQNEGIVHRYGWYTLGTTNTDGWFSAHVYKQPTGNYWELKIGTKKYIIRLESGIVNDLSQISYEVVVS